MYFTLLNCLCHLKRLLLRLPFQIFEKTPPILLVISIKKKKDFKSYFLLAHVVSRSPGKWNMGQQNICFPSCKKESVAKNSFTLQLQKIWYNFSASHFSHANLVGRKALRKNVNMHYLPLWPKSRQRFCFCTK